ncbi:dihydrolipoyl dehydrogenase [Legionella impletisoli]|uniref:Dihydrolipoyl dehydrogenase n=1 Tax=Legionella impletisoli TaxID=343510 RepID=A0A917JY30_9GAMM|nr:dihydrolipoyl dehydrogenase [Legionella impletisoli]GGI92141.1 dihydrolipoyl dehydrogenase [Legionella impletisoli]
MNRDVDVAIIGAGTAGLSAYKEARKVTENIVVVDKGPLGTTCARVGCMPSKVLLQAANYYHHRHHFKPMGIYGEEHVQVKIPDVLAHVRDERDRFTQSVVEFTKSLGDNLICEEAKLLSKDVIQVGNQRIQAKSIILATGSESIIPESWNFFKTKLLTSETLFEQNDLPNELAVIGAGSIGLEFGQALSRLGIKLSVYNEGSFIGGLTDPKVNKAATEIFKQEFSLVLNEKVSLTMENGSLMIVGDKKIPVEKVIAAIGRKPNLESLGLKSIGIQHDEKGLPIFDKTTMQIQDTSLFIAGDVNQERPLLHEAADEGRIAGFNAVNSTQCFRRRTLLRILFTEPNIAVIGQSFKELQQEDIVIGEVDYSDQGRAKIMLENKGILRIYGKKKTGELLGAELIAPDGEHIAHLLAWAIYKKLTAFDVLQMPFYHPVIEEGMRTALRDLARQVEEQSSSFDLALCDSEAIHPLS